VERSESGGLCAGQAAALNHEQEIQPAHCIGEPLEASHLAAHSIGSDYGQR
jgi:hypothetical protein